MNAFAGIRPKGGQNPTPLASFPGVCSGGYLFSSGGPTPTPPANFYPELHQDLTIKPAHEIAFNQRKLFSEVHRPSFAQKHTM